jgi:hypothetical protein
LDNRVKFYCLHQLPKEQVEGEHRWGNLEVVRDTVGDSSARDFNLLTQVTEQAVKAAKGSWLTMFKATELRKPGNSERNMLHVFPLKLLAKVQLVVMKLPETKQQGLTLQAIENVLVESAAMKPELLGKRESSILAVVRNELAGCKATFKVSPTVRQMQRPE